MDFSALLAALNQASGFELYRLRVAIDKDIEAERIRADQDVEVAKAARKVVTRRRGGSLSTTVPTMSASREPSIRRCSQRDDARQSETLACPQ